MQHDFGKAVEQRRRAIGWSYRGFSDALRERTGLVIDGSGLKRIEAGEREPRLVEALAIAQALGTRLSELTEVSAWDRSAALGEFAEVVSRTAESVAAAVEHLDVARRGLRVDQGDLAALAQDVEEGKEVDLGPDLTRSILASDNALGALSSLVDARQSLRFALSIAESSDESVRQHLGTPEIEFGNKQKIRGYLPPMTWDRAEDLALERDDRADT